jgi:glycosyltransferase involved in cell wall biosynthesis
MIRSASVIIPVYNGARFIGAALDSVLKQTVLPKEIILIDDGSTDDSLAVIAAAVADYSGPTFIQILSQDNGRQSAARNGAAKAATGDFLAFLDQDDSWHPEHLRLLLEQFEGQPDLGWVYSDFDEIDIDGYFVTRDFIRTHAYNHPKTSVRDFLAEDSMMLPSATIMRTEAFKGAGGFDAHLCGYEDDDLFLRLFRDGWRSTFVHLSLTRHRIHTSSSSSGNSFRESRLIYLQNVVKHTPDNPRLGRMFISDLLVPRLLATTLHEYSIALRTLNDEDARNVARDATIITSAAFSSRRRSLGLALMARPRLLRALLKVRARFPRWMRSKIPPSFELH